MELLDNFNVLTHLQPYLKVKIYDVDYNEHNPLMILPRRISFIA